MLELFACVLVIHQNDALLRNMVKHCHHFRHLHLYTFKGEGGQKKCTVCTLVKMMIIMDDPLQCVCFIVTYNWSCVVFCRSSNSLDGYARAPVVPPKHFEELPYESMFYGLWDCTADTETELSFKHGDVIQVVGREYESYNWLTCLLNGKIGLVPKDYLTPAYTRA